MPESGSLRLWTRDSGWWLRNGKPARDGGHYVEPDGVYKLSELGAYYTSYGIRGVALYVEAVKASQDLGDSGITIEVDPNGVGEFVPMVSDTVRVTTYGVSLKKIDENGQLSDATSISVSNPAPVISLTGKQISNLRLSSDGKGIIGDVLLSGTVDDALSDLIGGSEGLISNLNLLVNGDATPYASISVATTKGRDTTSLLKPYDYSGTFNRTLIGVPLEDGYNDFELVARNHRGFTGTAEVSMEVIATPPADYVVRVDLSFSDDPYLNANATVTASFTVGGVPSGHFLLQRSAPGSTVFVSPVLQSVIVGLGPVTEPVLLAGDTSGRVVSVVGPGLSPTGTGIVMERTGPNSGEFTGEYRRPPNLIENLPDYTLITGSVSIVSATGPGDFNPYIYAVEGPDLTSMISGLDLVSDTLPVLWDPERQMMTARQPGGFDPAVILAIGDRLAESDIPQGTSIADDLLDRGPAEVRFVNGAIVGFLEGGVGMITGVYDLGVMAVRGVGNAFTYVQNIGVRYVEGDTFEQERSFVVGTAGAVKSLFETIVKLKTDVEGAIFSSIVNGTYDPVKELPPEYQVIIDIGIDVIAAMWESLKTTFDYASDYRKGKMVGRSVFEIASLIVPGGVVVGAATKVTKLAFLQKLATATHLSPLTKAASAQMAGLTVALGAVATNGAVPARLGRFVSWAHRLQKVHRLGDKPDHYKILQVIVSKTSIKKSLNRDFVTMTTGIFVDLIKDKQKLPSYAQVNILLAGRRQHGYFVAMEAHHAAVKSYSRAMLKKAGLLVGKTEDEITVILDSMPAIVMNPADHAAFHRNLTNLSTVELNASDIATLKSMVEEACLGLGGEVGQEVWKQVDNWYRFVGIP